MLLIISFFALLTKLVFRKWGHNHYEHIIMNAYILAFYTMVNVALIYPLMYMFKTNLTVTKSLTSISILLTPFILLWFFKGFYSYKSFKSIGSRVLLILLFLIFLFFIAIILVVAIGFVIAAIKGPEALEYIKPQ